MAFYDCVRTLNKHSETFVNSALIYSMSVSANQHAVKVSSMLSTATVPTALVDKTGSKSNTNSQLQS